jgi:hypothetical protein
VHLEQHTEHSQPAAAAAAAAAGEAGGAAERGIADMSLEEDVEVEEF